MERDSSTAKLVSHNRCADAGLGGGAATKHRLGSFNQVNWCMQACNIGSAATVYGIQQWAIICWTIATPPSRAQLTGSGVVTYSCCCGVLTGLLQHMPGLGIRAIRYSMLVEDGKVRNRQQQLVVMLLAVVVVTKHSLHLWLLCHKMHGSGW